MKLEILKKVLTFNNLTMEKRKGLGHIVLLGIWALIQYSLGNKFYGLIIIAFSLSFIKSRSPHFMLLAAAVLIVVLFNTPTIDTWVHLKQSNLSTVENHTTTLTDIFSPNSGQKVLPIQVQRMLSLLRTNRISSYQLSNQYYSDFVIPQRITEAAWPIKMEDTSPYLLISTKEMKNNPTCAIVDQRKDVTLAYCH